MTDSASAMEGKFSAVYQTRAWHRRFRSGPGSDPEQAAEYVSVLQSVLERECVRSVVDLGCGDWSFSSTVDWSGIDYLGIDTVGALIEELTRRHGRPGVRFLHGDISSISVPEADLVIIKDVLQHWPSDAVHHFLSRITRHRLVLLTNDARIFKRGVLRFWTERELIPANGDTTVAGYRPLQLRKAPFQIEAELCCRLNMREGRVRFEKEVLLMRNRNA